MEAVTVGHSRHRTSDGEAAITGMNAGYVYIANSPLIDTVTFRQGSTTRMTTKKSYDKLNRLLSIASTAGAASPISYSYLYNDANQRMRRLNQPCRCKATIVCCSFTLS